MHESLTTSLPASPVLFIRREALAAEAVSFNSWPLMYFRQFAMMSRMLKFGTEVAQPVPMPSAPFTST